MNKTFVYSLTAAIALSSTLVAASPDVSAASYKLSKGKLVYAKSGKTVRGKVVYKSKLYNNGKLAKGTVLYKKTLYVDGKIISGIVKYNGKFYSNGKTVSSSKVFLYGDKLYKGNHLFPGYQSYEDLLFEDGELFTGIYKNAYYDYGTNYIEPHEVVPIFSTIDGTSMTYILVFDIDQPVTLNASDVTISDGATIQSLNIVKPNDIYSYAVIQIDNTHLNHIYKLTINNLTLGKYGAINLSGHIYSLDTDSQNNNTYKSALATYLKYSAYTNEQLKNMTSKEFEQLKAKIRDYGNIAYDIEDDNTYFAIEGLVLALYLILQNTPYYDEM